MDSHDADPELLKRVVDAIEEKNFFGSVLLHDRFDDWELVRELGSFLVRINDSEILGHALLLRAYRHMGKREPALSELKECRARTSRFQPGEEEMFVRLVSEESGFLSE